MPSDVGKGRKYMSNIIRWKNEDEMVHLVM